MRECSVDGCDRPAEDDRDLCRGHRARKQTGKEVNVELAPKPKSPLERVREAAITYADASSESDEAFDRADDNLRKSAFAYGMHVRFAELIRKGLEAARRRGVRLGRPPAVSPNQAADLLKLHGTKAQAAVAAGISPRALGRALRKAGR